MKFVLAFVLVFMTGCKSLFQKAEQSPILAPITSAVCSGESALVDQYGQFIASRCGGSYDAGGKSALEAKLGNLDVCNLSLPQPSPAPASTKDEKPKLKFGDITQGDLDKAKADAGTRGLVSGPVAAAICPFADSLLVGVVSAGLLSGDVGTALHCTTQVSDPTINQDVTALCVGVLGAIPL